MTDFVLSKEIKYEYGRKLHILGYIYVSCPLAYVNNFLGTVGGQLRQVLMYKLLLSGKNPLTDRLELSDRLLETYIVTAIMGVG
jgi:hypothetical protein